MRRLFLLVSAMLLGTLGGKAPAAEAPSQWTWQSDNPLNNPVTISFVRGNVRVIRRAGPVRIIVDRAAIRGAPESARISVQEEEGSILITDGYPPASPFLRECLPPTGSRGDFWNNEILLQTIVYLPRKTQLNVHLLEDRTVSSGSH